tara:strand:+ start:72 stop:272 length:201 start_codon:yes stop_codon:yes gene_type:complete
MLSPLQIQRVLKHCEKIEEQYANLGMAGDEGPMYFDMCRNQGWCEALRLVLGKDTMSIRDTEIKDE